MGLGGLSILALSWRQAERSAPLLWRSLRLALRTGLAFAFAFAFAFGKALAFALAFDLALAFAVAFDLPGFLVSGTS